MSKIPMPIMVEVRVYRGDGSSIAMDDWLSEPVTAEIIIPPHGKPVIVRLPAEVLKDVFVLEEQEGEQT